MEGDGKHDNGVTGTDSFVRDVVDDAVRQVSQEHGDPVELNGHNNSQTSVRDASSNNDSLGNAVAPPCGPPPKKYSLSVDAPPFIPSGARKFEPVVFGGDMSAGTPPAFSSTVAHHLNKISGAGEHFRANIQDQLKSIVPPELPDSEIIWQSDAPLASESSRGEGSDNETPLDRKLHAIPAANEGIVEDCPAPYVVTADDHKENSASAVPETVVRDTDATTISHQVEEINAEIHDTSAVEPEWVDVLGNGALMKKTVRKGEPGTRPVRSSIVTVRTSAEVLNSDLEASAMLKVVDKNDALRFTVSDLEVIQGLELAVQLMDLGEIAEVKMAPKYAYGEVGHQESGIPSDATLLYTLELLKVEPPQEVQNLTALDRVATANYKVDRGNFWYLRKEPMLALSLYQRAVSVLEAPTERYTSPEDTVQLNAAKARAYGNLSSAQVEEKIWDDGLRSVNYALRYDPNNGKLWCRKIKIFREKGQIEEAVSACEDVLQKGSLVAETFLQKAREELSSLRKKKRQADDKEKALYQRMLGSQSSKSGQNSSRNSPQPADERASQSADQRTSQSADQRASQSARRNISESPANPNRKLLFFGAAAGVAIFGAVIGLRYYQAHR